MKITALNLPPARVVPVLDPAFRPAVLATRSFLARVKQTGEPIPVGIALEQTGGNVSRFDTFVFPDQHPDSAQNFTFLERLIKFLLWSRGGSRLHVKGAAKLVQQLQAHYQQSPTGKFDSSIVAERMFDHPLEVIPSERLPEEKRSAAPLGRHLEGCRIGFDLGGSDRKAAALIDGQVVFSEEITWDPYFQQDPKYHLDGIMDSLTRAAAHLPRLDAIGGSAAGIYLNNEVKVASLFRGVRPEIFQQKVRPLFLEVQKAFGGVPFQVVNDGEVTALAGSMSLQRNRILGLSLGTSTAGGYVNAQGNITSWINELAFVPVDYRPEAPRDEWSGDYGCAVQYFSQQGVARLIGPAQIVIDPALTLPDQLKSVQNLMEKQDIRARRIYETIGVYLGYAAAHFADFYDLETILILGRVTSGLGGDIITAKAAEVLRSEFPELSEKISFHIPNEKEKRHGQAIAAASLPSLQKL